MFFVLFVFAFCQTVVYWYRRVVKNPGALLWFPLETPTLRPTLDLDNKVVVLVKELIPETM